MTIALLFLITTALFAIAAQYHHDRARNLDRRITQLLYDLDDATRQRDHLAHLHSALLAENTTMCVDLIQTEQRNQYLESLHRQRKGETAGVLITEFVVNPKRKLLVHTENMP